MLLFLCGCLQDFIPLQMCLEDKLEETSGANLVLFPRRMSQQKPRGAKGTGGLETEIKRGIMFISLTDERKDKGKYYQ